MVQWLRLLLALPLVAGLCPAAVPAALAQAPEVVWVCQSGSCGEHTPGVDAFNSIQQGIGAVATGGMVHVAAGIYDENVSVNKAVTLEGAGAASTTLCGAVDIGGAEGIAVRHLTFTGRNGPGTGDGHIVHLHEAGHAVLENSTLKTIANYANSYGLLVTNTTGATCRNLTISSVGSSTESAGVMLGDGAIGNTFEGLAIDSVSSSGNASGLKLAAAQGNTFTNLTISNVSTSSSVHPAWGIYAGGSDQRFDGVSLSSLHGGQVRGAQLSKARNTTLRGVCFDATGSTSSSVSQGILVDISSSAIAIEDSEISHTGQGITINNSTVTVLGCLLAFNDEGVQAGSGSTVALHGNSIAGNTNYGLRNNNVGGNPSVDATGNWWGSPSGPKVSSNAGGTGAVITAGVVFSPWLSEGADTSLAAGFQASTAPQYAIARRLAFSTQPGGAAMGSPLSPQPVLRAEDEAGHLGINFQGLVTLAVGSNSYGGALSGTNPVSAVQGVAAFTNLAIDKAGKGYTLSATSGSLTAATSAPFDVSGQAPTITALTPDHATAGAAALTLVVSGTGFAPGAQVRWNGAGRSTTYGSATQLSAQIGEADLATAGTAAVTVANPDGAASGGQAFTIRPRPATVYANEAWATVPDDADPDGAGPATHFGYDAFSDAQAALAAVAPGGRVVLASAHVAGGLTVNTAGLTIDLNGATVGPGSPAFTVAADDVTIEDGILDGAGDTGGASAIVVNAGVARLWIHHCEIRHWPGDGIHLNGAVAGLKIMENDIHDNGGDGLELNGTPTGTVVIVGNSLRSNAGYGINAVSGSVTARYNEWGHIDGPAAGRGVHGAVDAAPWLYGQLNARVSGPAQVRAGTTFDVDVLADAASLYGAQFALAFDPTLLEVAGTASSGEVYFTGTLPATVAYSNVAGTLSYHGSRQAGEAPYSGLGGKLLTVHFRARPIAGTATVATIDIVDPGVRLAALGGIGIPGEESGDDSVTIVGETTVSGVVHLQGRGDWRGAIVDASPGTVLGFDPAPVTTDSWGRYALVMADDSYTITVALARYLRATATVPVIGGTQVLAPVELLGGDIDGLDGIGINDITGISGLLFGTEVDPAATPADINYDGWVDILDLVLAAGNYGLQASPWSP